MVNFLLLFLAFNLCLHETLALESVFSFSFERFKKINSTSLGISLHGDSEIRDSVVWITRKMNSSSGQIVYKKLLKFEGTNPEFSTSFSFSISGGNGGAISFWMVPESSKAGFLKGVSSGLTPKVVSVELNGSMASKNVSENQLELSIGNQISVESRNLSHVLSSGEKLRCWVDYDGGLKKVEVRLGNFSSSRPSVSVISYLIDLSNLFWRSKMIVGISSLSKNSKITVYSWSFITKHGAPYLMHSDPLNPQSFPSVPDTKPSVPSKQGFPWIILLALAFGAACGAMVAFFVTLICSRVVCHRPVAPVEYPVHPVDLGYEKVVLVQGKAVEPTKEGA